MSEVIRKNRLILLVLSAVLGLCMVWAFGAQTVYAADKHAAEVSVDAEYDFVYGGIQYMITSENQSEVMVWACGDPEPTGSLVIPEKVLHNGKNYRVTRIDEYAFTNCKGITSVDIPVSVTSIGEDAFTNTGLTKVLIPYSVKTIEEHALGFNRNEEFVYSKVPGFTIEAAFGNAGFRYGKQNGFITYDPSVMSVTVDQNYVNADIIAAAIDAAGGKREYIMDLTLGPNVKKLEKGSLAPFANIKNINVKTKKLKKKSVKGSLKGSAVKTVKVQIGKKKVNKKYVKKYKKIFTKKNCGKKVKVKR